MASVLVTGGASGLGAEIAIYFAKQGYNVALHHFLSDPSAITDIILSFGVKCTTYRADLSIANNDLIDRVLKNFDDLEVLVNNASIFCTKKYSDLSEPDYDSLMNIHVKNPLFLSNKFANLQTAKSIINIADSLAFGNGDLFLQGFSKASMVQMSAFLAKNVAPKVRVNSICPNCILTEENKIIPANKTTFMNRWGKKEEFLLAVDYLVKNNYVTGQNINVDGGGFVLDK